MSDCPLARDDELVVEPLDDELVVFDSRAQRAHSLNETAATVWQACNGSRSPGTLAAHCSLDLVAVELALEELARCDLLVGYVAADGSVSRRTVLRRAALTGAGLGLTLPVIRSITAPSAAMATSNVPKGGKCNNTSLMCASGHCGSLSTCKSSPGVPHGSHCYAGSNSCVYGSHCSSVNGNVICTPGYL